MMAHAKEAYGMPTIIDDATLAQLKGASPIVQERFAAMCIVGLSNRLQAKFPNPELKVFDSAPAAEEGSAAEDGESRRNGTFLSLPPHHPRVVLVR